MRRHILTAGNALLPFSRLSPTAVVPSIAATAYVRAQSTNAQGAAAAAAAATQLVGYEQVWGLWNEGNLFSLSLTQLQSFLASTGVKTDPSLKKAAVVRQVEEYLHSKDAAGSSAAAGGAGAPGEDPQAGAGRYGKWGVTGTMQPETLLDLAQSGFYEGAAHMAPKAFQLLPEGGALDVVVSRVNTTAFPGFPANTECYTLTASESGVAVRARFSKVLQWCYLNLSNLQMDGELQVDFGKLLLHADKVLRQKNNHYKTANIQSGIVSSYSLQQRLQLNNPYSWVSAVPESATPVMEKFLASEGFAPVGAAGGGGPQHVQYEGTIQRAKDVLQVVLDNRGQLTSLNGDWVDIQTVNITHPRGPDVRLRLRSRPPTRRPDLDTYRGVPIITLSDDDVADALPSEHGQLVYLAENEVRRFERVDERGNVLVVTEVKRQPLIVIADEQEDPRIEYTVSAVVPAVSHQKSGGGAMDVRAVGLGLFDLAERGAAAIAEEFGSAFGCDV